MERLVVAMLLFTVSSQAEALTKIDTGLGNPVSVSKKEQIKHFASLAEDEVGALPNKFTICSSISTADATSPLCFFQVQLLMQII